MGFAYWFVGLKKYYKFVPRLLKKLIGRYRNDVTREDMEVAHSRLWARGLYLLKVKMKFKLNRFQARRHRKSRIKLS